jgi:hypothetical protein
MPASQHLDGDAKLDRTVTSIKRAGAALYFPAQEDESRRPRTGLDRERRDVSIV